jgi:hypothetical protein
LDLIFILIFELKLIVLQEMLSSNSTVYVSFHYRYGFTLDKLICVGYIRHPGIAKGDSNGHQIVTNEFIMAPDARYEIDIAGQRFLAKPHIRAPYIPHINMDSTSHRYRPTVVNLKAT